MTHTDRHPSTWSFGDWIAEVRECLDEAEQVHARMVAGELTHRTSFDRANNMGLVAFRVAIRQAVQDWDDLNTDIPDAGALVPRKKPKRKPPVQTALFDAPEEER